MSFLTPPSPPNPQAVANIQQKYNTKAQQQSMIGQQTPQGSLTWVKDPNSPGGYKAVQQYSPAELGLFNLQIGGQTGLGQAGQSLGGDISAMLGAGPPDLSPEAMTKQLMDWQTQYMQPYWNQQQSNLDSTLGNQGITPGSTAYNNAENLLSRNISDQRNQFFAQSEPLAFGQQMQKYQFPVALENQILGGAAPQGPSFVPTPQVQPPDYQTAAQQAYQAQNQQYGNMMQGLFGIPTALAGGWAKSGFPMPSFGG